LRLRGAPIYCMSFQHPQISVSSRPWEPPPQPLPGRVEDWRGGLSAPSPAPASSNPACRFPAPGFPACFTSRLMGPIRLGALSVAASTVGLCSC
jgi:hypothetical protein